MFVKDLKLIFSDRKMLILLALLVIISVAGVIFCIKETRGPAVRFGIADEDQTEDSYLLVIYFDENEVFNEYFKVVRGTKKELEEAFDRGELDMYMVIPEGFTRNLKSYVNMPIETIINNSDKTKLELMSILADTYSEYITAVQINCKGLTDMVGREDFDSALVQRELVLTALGKDSFFRRKTIDRFEGISLVNYYIYSGIILIILYAGLFAGLKSLKERLGKAGERLVSVGVGRGKIFFSSLSAFVLVYTVIMGIALGLIAGLGELTVPPVAIFFVFLAIVVVCSLFMLISKFVKSVPAYMILGNMLILFTTIAGGGIIPIMYLPEGCIAVARFTPTYWFIKLILQTGF
jgi:ABC-2 type transport system permease protein